MEDARSFTVRLADLLARERSALGDLLVAPAEFDRKRLWLALGYGSHFDFLHRELGLSTGLRLVPEEGGRAASAVPGSGGADP